MTNSHMHPKAFDAMYQELLIEDELDKLYVESQQAETTEARKAEIAKREQVLNERKRALIHQQVIHIYPRRGENMPEQSQSKTIEARLLDAIVSANDAILTRDDVTIIQDLTNDRFLIWLEFAQGQERAEVRGEVVRGHDQAGTLFELAEIMRNNAQWIDNDE